MIADAVGDPVNAASLQAELSAKLKSDRRLMNIAASNQIIVVVGELDQCFITIFVTFSKIKYFSKGKMKSFMMCFHVSIFLILKENIL